MSIVDDTQTRQIEAIIALLNLARSNFPGNTDVEIRATGGNSGSVRVPYYVLLKALESKP